MRTRLRKLKIEVREIEILCNIYLDLFNKLKNIK